jgi:hypothetical protein
MCTACTVHTYQGSTGQASCASCPVGKYTVTSAAEHHSQCEFQCREGTYRATRAAQGLEGATHARVCVPMHSEVHGAPHARPCSHVRCSMSQREARESIRIQHSKFEEHGNAHTCAYSAHFDECSCFCYHENVKSYVAKQRGVHRFSPTGYNTLKCEDVAFPHSFDPAKGPVRVLTTVAHSQHTWIGHDPSVMWVEHASATSFRVCGYHQNIYERQWEHGNHNFNVEYFAWQGDNRAGRGRTPWSGAQSGAARVRKGGWAAHSADASQTCQRVKFGKPFGRVPMVVGTIDYASNSNAAAQRRHATAHWIENIDEAQFMVCFRSAHGDSVPDAMAFNWLAFEHKNPALWFKQQEQPYSVAGRTAGWKTWSAYSHARSASMDGKSVFLNCKVVPFGREFPVMPTVLVTANHVDKRALDWGVRPGLQRSHASIATYIDEIGTKSFKVCTAESATSAELLYDSGIQWDWLVVGDNADMGTPSIASQVVV